MEALSRGELLQHKAHTMGLKSRRIMPRPGADDSSVAEKHTALGAVSLFAGTREVLVRLVLGALEALCIVLGAGARLGFLADCRDVQSQNFLIGVRRQFRCQEVAGQCIRTNGQPSGKRSGDQFPPCNFFFCCHLLPLELNKDPN
jgi:hypothetical protein